MYQALAIGLSIIISISAFVILIVQIKKIHRICDSLGLEIDAFRRELAQIKQTNNVQEEKLHEVHSGMMGTSDKLLRLESNINKATSSVSGELAEFRSKIEDFTSSDPTVRLYNKAAKLVASGASIREVITECDLPQAEAELLMNLYSKDK